MNEEYIANAERRRKIADDMAWSSGYVAGRAAAIPDGYTLVQVGLAEAARAVADSQDASTYGYVDIDAVVTLRDALNDSATGEALNAEWERGYTAGRDGALAALSPHSTGDTARCPDCGHDWHDHGPRGCEVRYGKIGDDGMCVCTEPPRPIGDTLNAEWESGYTAGRDGALAALSPRPAPVGDERLREAAQAVLDRALDVFDPDDLDPESSFAMPVTLKARWVYALRAALEADHD